MHANKTQIVISALTLILSISCGAGSADMSAPNMAGGVTPGGSQDAGYFRGLLLSGAIPQADDITLEGFISEHDMPGAAESCDQVICIRALVGTDRAVSEGGSATFVQLAMSSNVNLDNRPRMPLNMAVVVDVSGSMSSDNKLEYVKQGLRYLLDELDGEDRLALVTYSSTAQVAVPSQMVLDKSVFLAAINALAPGGSTNLYAGMVLGYDEVAPHVDTNSVARVMLLTDGLANVGISDSASILAKSSEYTALGIGITTIGVGLDFNQDLMRDLSEQGGGNFYFLEDVTKVTTVFQEELDFLVTPLANNLVITIALGPDFDFVDAFGFSVEWDADGKIVLNVPTVFASRRGGALLIRVAATSPLAELEGDVVANITYSYQPIDDAGQILAAVNDIVDARVPTLDGERAFDEAAVLKSIVLWNMVDSFHAASNAYHLEYNQGQALEQIEALALYVDDANLRLEDPEIARDRAELINQFAINLGGYVGDPTYYDDMPMGGCGGRMAYTVCGDDVVYHPFYCGAAPGSTLPVVLVGLMLFVVRRFKRSANNAA